MSLDEVMDKESRIQIHTEISMVIAVSRFLYGHLL